MVKLRFRLGLVTAKPFIIAHSTALTACLMVKLRFRLGLYSYCKFVSTQHGALEFGSDLHVNESEDMTLLHYVY